MIKFLKQEANKTYTENGAVSYYSTLSDCLDLFARIGSLRFASDEEIKTSFFRGFFEDKDSALKILFYARDIREGLGERRSFRVILKALANVEADAVRKNIKYIAEYGRFDDLWGLLDTPLEKDVAAYVKEQLSRDSEAESRGEEVSLLAKWMPSINGSNSETKRLGRKLARLLNMDFGTYRKLLSKLRAHIGIIENSLRKAEYTFEYKNQPSKALLKYRGAFIRNDGERYTEFLNAAVRGKEKFNTETVTPYEIIRPCLKRDITEEERASLNAMWLAQKDYCSKENSIAVIDGSGSMYMGQSIKPAFVALSLGIYFAERNKGVFNNHFITFSQTPRLVEIKGGDIVEKVKYCSSFNEVANTDIQKVFELILNTAIKNKLSQKEIVDRIYIISDMEFDCCAENSDLTNFEYARKMYAEAGFRLPQVVFWDVESRNQQLPVTKNEQGVTLVSGCTPKIFSMAAKGDLTEASPYEFMKEVLESERYKNISA